MPPPAHRKKPFSAKQKKRQLQERRERMRDGEGHDWGGGCGRQKRGRGRGRGRGGGRGHHGHTAFWEGSSSEGSGEEEAGVQQINQQPVCRPTKGYDPNRYRMHFQKESRAEISLRQEQARQPLQMLPESDLEVDIDEIYLPGTVLDMPKRPSWNYKMSKEQLLAREENYFREYLENIMEKHRSEELSYFELNLETWRQLWRVLEMSDIILLITDIRHPAIHFSPALYDFVTRELNKPLILVLNKIDFMPPGLVVAWKHYFQEKFPELHIVVFTSFPKEETDQQLMNQDPSKVLHKYRRKRCHKAVGPRELFKACENIVQGKVDLSSWKEKIEGDLAGIETDSQAEIRMEEGDGSYVEHVRFRDGMLTIGCCGYPNVGKSSLMNGLVGKKVVSVSRTPGHTKHFQTIYLTPSVKLCDSPGLVFPSLVHKPMQILAGIYPIAQVREPYTAVGYLAQRIPIPQLLKLTHPDLLDQDPKDQTPEPLWSAYDICDAWAEKRGFFTARAARNDVYRAANSILRMAVNGRLIVSMRPPGYTAKKAQWESHPEAEEIALLQRSQQKPLDMSSEDEDGSLSESEGEIAPRIREQPDSAAGGVAVSNPFELLADDD